jgi:hypothetical protein
MSAFSRRPVLAAALAAIAAPAIAQPAPTIRVRGRIARFDGEVLTVATREGPEAQISLPESAVVAALRRVAIADLVAGTPLGVVAEPHGEGPRAVAVTILPPTATRQFQSAWDLSDGSSMNNGAVQAVVQRADGHELTLSINGRAVPVRVDERTALIRPIEASRADLIAGAAVMVNATRGDDGKLAAVRVTVEKDGVAPAT